MKDDLPFFEHDNDALGNDRMQALMAQFGFEGYGRFWALNERIAASSGAVLDISTKVIKNGLASFLRMNVAELDAFLKFLSDKEECGLIVYEDGKITTERTQKSYQKVRKDREDAKARKMGKRPTSDAVKPTENTGSPEPSQSSPEPSQSSANSDRTLQERTNERTNEDSSFVSEVFLEPPVGAREAPPSGSVQPGKAVIGIDADSKAKAKEFIRQAQLAKKPAAALFDPRGSPSEFDPGAQDSAS